MTHQRPGVAPPLSVCFDKLSRTTGEEQVVVRVSFLRPYAYYPTRWPPPLRRCVFVKVQFWPEGKHGTQAGRSPERSGGSPPAVVSEAAQAKSGGRSERWSARTLSVAKGRTNDLRRPAVPC